MGDEQAVLKTDSSDAVDFKSGPMVEIEFWAKKQSNLRNIDAQLHSDRVQKVQKILDISRSTYAPAFSKIATEVQEALAQTRDINKYLTVLRKQIEPMRQAAADDITKTWKVRGYPYTPVLQPWRGSWPDTAVLCDV